MKKQIFTLCAMLLALCSLADAQWIIDGQQVQTLNLNVSDPQALYTDGSRQMTAPVKFSQSLTATNGALQIYAIDNEDHLGYFKTLSFQDGLQFCTEGSASLLFGSGNAGLLVGPSTLVQLEYGKHINFETGELTGSTGAKEWHVTTDPIDASGIVSKGYADTHYLRSDADLNEPISFAQSLVETRGLFRAYYDPEGEDVEFFIINGGEERVELSDVCGTLKVGEAIISGGGIRSLMSPAKFNFEDKLFSGGWMVADIPDNSAAIMSRGYADGRYLQRTEGITTNRVIQAGNTLVISNGLITAIIP